MMAVPIEIYLPIIQYPGIVHDSSSYCNLIYNIYLPIIQYPRIVQNSSSCSKLYTFHYPIFRNISWQEQQWWIKYHSKIKCHWCFTTAPAMTNILSPYDSSIHGCFITAIALTNIASVLFLVDILDINQITEVIMLEVMLQMLIML